MKPTSVNIAGGLLVCAGAWSGFLALTLTVGTFFVWVPAYTCGIVCAAYALLIGILLLAGAKIGRGFAISGAVVEMLTIVDCDIIGIGMAAIALSQIVRPETTAWFTGAPMPLPQMAVRQGPGASKRARLERRANPGPGFEIDTTYNPLAFLLALTHPVVTVDGTAFDLRWGRGFVPAEPGTHQVKVHYPYLFIEGNPANAELEVQPGHVTLVRYQAPIIVMMAGRLIPYGSEPVATALAAPESDPIVSP